MTAEDAPTFINQLIMLAELFDAKLSEVKQHLYFEALSDLSLNDLTNGLREAARYSKFMPKPIEIREFAVGSLQDKSENAWLDLRRSMQAIGRYGEWKTDDAAAEVACEEVFGTFSRACTIELTPEMWQAKKKEFMRVYMELERAEIKVGSLMASGTFPKLLGS